MRTSSLSKASRSAYERPVELKTSLAGFLKQINPWKLLDFSSKNPANGGVLCLGRRLLALHEVLAASCPHFASHFNPSPASSEEGCNIAWHEELVVQQYYRT